MLMIVCLLKSLFFQERILNFNAEQKILISLVAFLRNQFHFYFQSWDIYDKMFSNNMNITYHRITQKQALFFNVLSSIKVKWKCKHLENLIEYKAQTRILTMHAQLLEHAHTFCISPNCLNKVHSWVYEKGSSAQSWLATYEINSNIKKKS